MKFNTKRFSSTSHAHTNGFQKSLNIMTVGGRRGIASISRTIDFDKRNVVQKQIMDHLMELFLLTTFPK